LFEAHQLVEQTLLRRVVHILAAEVPVYFVYISAWGMPDGIVQFRDDIYQMDGNAELALDTTEGMEKPVQ
ncbi:murein L,D-transpeptidase, partial [Rhizobium johnstonii]